MAEHYDDGLSYGHFGELTYYSNDQKWESRRFFGPQFTIQAVGSPQAVIPAPQNSLANSHEDILSELPAGPAKLPPDLVPASDVLESSERLSKAVLKSIDQHDPVLGTLLTFGRIRDVRSERERVLAAFVSDSARKQLCVMTVQSQRQGWTGDNETSIKMPQFGDETAHWNSASPILQIVLSHGVVERNSLLAVRTFYGTYVLQIRLEKSIVAAHADVATRFDISVLCFVPVEDSRASLHLHVCLNPWSPGQFAVIDMTGRWRVLDIKARVFTTADAESDTRSGMLDPMIDEERHESLYNSWSRISWVRDQDIVLVCNRTTLIATDIRAGSTFPLALGHKATEQSGLKILDMQLDPNHKDRVFFLTTLYVYYTCLSRKMNPKTERSQGLHLKLLAKVRHHKDQADPSLQLSISKSGMETIAILSSSISRSLSCIIFDNIAASNGAAVKVSIPHLMPSLSVMTSSPAVGIFLWPASWKVSESETAERSLAQVYYDEGLKFFSAVTFHKDLGISQQRLAFVPDTKDHTGNVVPPQWKAKISLTSAYASSGFIVEDDDEDDLEDDETSKPLQKVEVKHKSRPVHKRTLELDEFYESLVGHDNESSQDMTSHMPQLQTIIASAPQESSSSKSLLADFGNAMLTVSDLDDSDEALNALLENFNLAEGEDNNQPKITPLANPDLLHIHLPAPEQPLTLRTIYNSIVAAHLTPLPHSIPARIRLAREQQARRTAAQLALAAHQLSRPAPSPAGDDLSQALSRLSLISSSPLTPPVGLSSAQRILLSQWSPGADPAHFDFAQAHRAAQQQREDEGLSEPERARRERRARKLAVRKEREARRAFESSQVAAPEVVASSQPARAVGSRSVDARGWGDSSQMFGSSQAPGSSQMFASSQAQRGRASTVKKKKARRMEGF